MRRRPRDFQKTAVYRWERLAGLVAHDDPTNHLNCRAKMSLNEAQELVARIWNGYPTGRFGGGVPVVKAGRRTSKRAGYWLSRHEITLPPWALQVGVVAHEVAHAVAFSHVPITEIASHGPEFVRIRCEIAVAYEGADPERLGAVADDLNIRVASINQLPWRRRV